MREKHPPRPDGPLPKSVQVGLMMSCYGALLTEKQRRALSLHYDEDLSLAESADELEVSRQGVYDLIERSTQRLYRYENGLGLVRKTLLTERLLTEAREKLAALATPANQSDIDQIDGLLRQALAEWEGDDHGV